MRHVNLSRREINLLEDVCFTKLLTIDNVAIIEKDSDINVVIRNITTKLLTLGKESPYYAELKSILEKFVKLRDIVFKRWK